MGGMKGVPPKSSSETVLDSHITVRLRAIFNEVGIVSNGTVTNTTHQGGIVSIYCLGANVGAFAGGWLADRIGRISGLL